MPETDISSAVASDLTNAMTDYSVDVASTDAAADQPETTWMNNNWTQYLGYYKEIPELAAVIDAKAAWTTGKGLEADPQTTFIIDSIKGNGKDTFTTILENMERTKEIGGDAYAEIIRDKDGNFINLKPMDPAVMKHVVNRAGVIIRFEQMSKYKGKKPQKFKPEDIFYLPRNRVADEIHGNCMTERLATIILMRNEAMTDYKLVLHRFVKPRWIIHLDTDDTTKIAAFKAKWDKANEDGENMFVPKGVVVPELMTTPPNATLNPQAWIESLNNYFYEAAQVPKIIVGGSGGFTDAAVKIAYLAFEQNIKAEQLFMEEQVGMQLGLKIELLFPASLEQGLLSGVKKDGETTAAQPNDTTASLPGRD